MDQKERMLRNLPYKAWLDGLPEERLACQKKLWEYNNLPPERWEERPALLKSILGGLGEGSGILPPLRCDYGTNLFLGEHVEVNYNLTVLDVGRVTIGDRVLIAPNVSIYTAGHPVHPQSRRSGYEYGIDVSIGDDVWIGGRLGHRRGQRGDEGHSGERGGRGQSLPGAAPRHRGGPEVLL